MVSIETLNRLQQVDTPTVCNVIELYGIVPRNLGYLDGRIKSNFPSLPPMVGFAATASFRASFPPGKGDAYGSMQKQLEQFEVLPGPAVVVFQDLDEPPAAAVFGEVMCSTYRAFGAAGLVTNGAGRDIEQIRPLEFPVFTGSTICSHGYCHILHIGLPVYIGGMPVHQGELLHGDANGVCKIPLEIASEIPDVAKEFADAEAIMLDYLKSPGIKSKAEFNRRREAFQERVRALEQRLKSTK